MPILQNPRHEAFCRRVATPGVTKVQAYRECIARNPGSGSTLAHTASATTLLENPAILARIDEIKEDIQLSALFRFNLTRERWLQMFLNLATKARKAGDYSASKGCLREIGLAMPGWYTPVQVEVSADVHVTSWVQKIRQNLEQAKVIECDTLSQPSDEVDFSCD